MSRACRGAVQARALMRRTRLSSGIVAAALSCSSDIAITPFPDPAPKAEGKLRTSRTRTSLRCDGITGSRTVLHHLWPLWRSWSLGASPCSSPPAHHCCVAKGRAAPKRAKDVVVGHRSSQRWCGNEEAPLHRLDANMSGIGSISAWASPCGRPGGSTRLGVADSDVFLVPYRRDLGYERTCTHRGLPGVARWAGAAHHQACTPSLPLPT